MNHRQTTVQSRSFLLANSRANLLCGTRRAQMLLVRHPRQTWIDRQQQQQQSRSLLSRPSVSYLFADRARHFCLVDSLSAAEMIFNVFLDRIAARMVRFNSHVECCCAALRRIYSSASMHLRKTLATSGEHTLGGRTNREPAITPVTPRHGRPCNGSHSSCQRLRCAVE